MSKPRLTLDKMRAVARNRGGFCLSKNYINNRTALLWQCSEGHQWRAKPYAVLGAGRAPGSWCPECAIENTRGRGPMSSLTIKEMQAIAQSREGRCLSRHYANNKSPLLWECSQGHRWEATPPECPVWSST